MTPNQQQRARQAAVTTHKQANIMSRQKTDLKWLVCCTRSVLPAPYCLNELEQLRRSRIDVAIKSGSELYLTCNCKEPRRTRLSIQKLSCNALSNAQTVVSRSYRSFLEYDTVITINKQRKQHTTYLLPVIM